MSMAPRGRNGGGGSGSLRALMVLVAGALVVAIAFGAGILVGRHWESTAARESDSREPAAPAKKAAGKRVAAGEPEADRAREAGDKLTFYHTLAAPLGPPPAYPKAAPEGKARAGAPSATAPGAGSGHGAAPGAPAGGTTAAPAASAPSAPASPAAWTVQVGAFGSRQQADTLQQDLRRAGFEAYLSPLPASDGQTRFRVRVGTFADRGLAQRAADRLRAERSLPTFVTAN